MTTRRSLFLACAAALQLLLLAQPTSSDQGLDSCTATDAQPHDLSGGNGGVLKRVLKSGAGDPPPTGSWLKARYIGTLDGGVLFDRSPDDAPLGFTLGKGDVIKGWDIAFATMAVGEVANLTQPHKWPAVACELRVNFDRWLVVTGSSTTMGTAWRGCRRGSRRTPCCTLRLSCCPSMPLPRMARAGTEGRWGFRTKLLPPQMSRAKTAAGSAS